MWIRLKENHTAKDMKPDLLMGGNVLKDKKIRAVILSSDEMNVILIYDDGSYINMYLDEDEIVIKLKRSEREDKMYE